VLGEDFVVDLVVVCVGDEVVFVCIWCCTQLVLLRFLRVRDFVLVDDVVVEVWVIVIDWLSDFEGDEVGFRVWMIMIVWWCLIDYYCCMIFGL